MRTFTRIIAPALAVALGMGVALPAAAHDLHRDQPARFTPVRNDAIRADIQALRAQIDRAAARHAISAREAAGLRQNAAGIHRLYASYARDGLSHRETQVLRAKIDKVHFALHVERSDHDGRRG